MLFLLRTNEVYGKKTVKEKCIIQEKKCEKRKDLFKWILWKEQKEVLWKTMPIFSFFLYEIWIFHFFTTHASKKTGFPSCNSGPEGPLLHKGFDLHRERTWLPDTGHKFVTVFMLNWDIIVFQSTNWSLCGSRKFHVHTMEVPWQSATLPSWGTNHLGSAGAIPAQPSDVISHSALNKH